MQVRIRIAAIACLCLGALAFAPPAAPQEPPLADRAEAAYQAGDWATAETLYARLVEEPGSGAFAAFRLGSALLYLGRVPEARTRLDAAEAAGWTPAAIAYRRACADALEGKTADAVAQLEKAVAGGFQAVAALDGEPLLAAVRDDPGYAAVKESIERKGHPCRFDPRYRAFDFWLGEWDVRPAGAPDTAPPSENLITLEYDGCVVMEHWTSIGGGTGSSFNLFDVSRWMWFQTWVDSSGGLHEYRGNPDAQGNMILQGETPGAPGQPARVPTRLSFFKLAPDTVRQFSEISTDGGKTWTTSYDLTYVRRKPAAPAG